MNRNNYSTTRNLIFETTMSLNNNERVFTHPFNWVFLVTIHIYLQLKKFQAVKKRPFSNERRNQVYFQVYFERELRFKESLYYLHTILLYKRRHE